MRKKVVFPLKVFFDGGCPVCSREIEHYRKMGGEDKLIFVDIDDPEFAPEEYGLTREDFMKEMHAMDASGEFYRGVDAFRALWSGLPVSIYGDLAGLLGLPGIHHLSKIGYRGFARMRRFLPRVEKTCEDRCDPRHRH
jgi:predicted DCC family thiol-disulfide oxidoreductase YuxK